MLSSLLAGVVVSFLAGMLLGKLAGRNAGMRPLDGGCCQNWLQAQWTGGADTARIDAVCQPRAGDPGEPHTLVLVLLCFCGWQVPVMLTLHLRCGLKQQEPRRRTPPGSTELFRSSQKQVHAALGAAAKGCVAASSKGGEAEKDAEVLVAAADAEEDAEAVKKEEEEVEKKQNTGSEREQEDQRHSGASSVASTASIRLRHQHAPGFRDRAVPDFLCSRRLSAPDSSNSGEEHLVHTLCLDAKSDSKMVDWDTNVRFQVGSYVADLALFNLREYKYARPCVGIASNISTNGVVGIEPQTVVTIDGQGKLTVTDDKCKDQAEAAYEDWKKRFRQMYMHVPDDGTEVRLPPGDYVLGPCYYMPQTKACLASLDLPLVNSAYVLPAGPYQFLQIMLLAGAGEKVKKITVADVDAAVERWQEERLCISRLHTPAADFNWVF
ncbi:hypothetical protein WJX72_000721 [[Myrmecia] bisecta]|uniref:Uncharacterized protein n=1 Tax=[Myrmecia] bisecta TaxID=41462 RepID=A0AAW1QE61_9CHLO